MLSPSEYEHLCDQLMTLYDDLDNAIINDMVRRMMRMGRVSEATAWQARQLQQSGLLYDDILSEIASRTDASEAQVRTLFEDAGVQSIRNDNRSYTAAGLESIIRLSPAALQTLNAGYMKCSGDLKNMTLTTANTAQTAYINACDLAYMEVTSGTMDYGTAIRRAVQSAAGEGSWVLYPTGHRDRLDVAVRRSVLTGVGQTVRQISVINANDMGCDLMEITAHSGARPTHAVWQGKLASLSGKNAGRTIDGAKVYSLRDIGYGEADGFGGVNCRHDWFPFFEGISSRAYSDERLQQLNARNIEYNGKMYTEYEIDQMQRKLERKIREMKRRVSAADTAVREAPDDQTANQMKDLFTSESVKLKKAEKNLKDFLSQTGNLNDSTRTWVNGFGRSTAQNAVYANKKAQNKKKSKTVDNSQNSGIIKLSDNSSNYKPVTQQSIENVKYIEVFEPDVNNDMLIDEAASAYEEAEQKNVRYQEACRDLLREVISHPELKVGTEFSIVYDENMNRIKGYDYIIGIIGSVNLDSPPIPHHAFHNHGSCNTFSYTDIWKFLNTDNMISLSAVGNSENNYIIMRTDESDTEGYKYFLAQKAREVIYSANGVDFTIELLQKISRKEIDDTPLSQLNDKQRHELNDLGVKFSQELVERCEDYGFKYITNEA